MSRENDDLKIGIKAKNVTLVWQLHKCTHAGICARSLPGVFFPKELKCEYQNGMLSDKIEDTVNNCPSGALSIKK